MTNSEPEKYTYPELSDDELGAFLADASEDASRQAEYQQSTFATIRLLSTAADKLGLDLTAGTPTANIEEPVFADIFRDNLINIASTIRFSYDRALKEDDLDAMIAIERQKKEVMAGYMIVGAIKQGDPWFTLVDEVLPGEAIDENKLEDNMYFVEAFKEQQEANESKPKITNILEKVLTIIETHALIANLNDDEIERIFTELVRIFETSHTDIPGMESEIDEFARTENIDPAEAGRLKKLAKKHAKLL